MSSYPIKNLKRHRKPLSGLRVLLTRAGDGNDSLAAALREFHAIPILFPCSQIAPVTDPSAWQKLLHNQSRYTGLIFTSRHTVPFLKPHWPSDYCSLPSWAIGESTAQAVVDAKLSNPRVPTKLGSEGLLTSLDESQENNHWCILGGYSPRPLLENALQQRGAITTFIACYQRVRPTYHERTIRQLEREKPALIVIQSMDALEALSEFLLQVPNHDLLSLPLILPSDRYKKRARERGFTGSLESAGCANSTQILEHILNREQTGGTDEQSN